jgi:hypothetical protein
VTQAGVTHKAVTHKAVTQAAVVAWRSSGSTLALLFAVWLAPGIAAGAADGVDTARGHFRRGVELYRAGVHDAALAEFTRAYEAAPHPRILYNIAQIHVQRRDYAEALTFFRRYLEEGAAEIPEQRVIEVDATVQELLGLVASLVVQVNVDDAQLFVDGTLVTSLPSAGPLLINAGVRRLRVEKHGHRPFAFTATAAGGDELKFAIELEADPRPPLASRFEGAPPVVLHSVSEGGLDRTPFWVGVAVTGGLAAVTTTLGLLTYRANRDLEHELRRYPADRGGVKEARAQVRDLALATDVVGLSTIAAAVVTAVVYTSPSEPDLGPLQARIGVGSGELMWVGQF